MRPDAPPPAMRREVDWIDPLAFARELYKHEESRALGDMARAPRHRARERAPRDRRRRGRARDPLHLREGSRGSRAPTAASSRSSAASPPAGRGPQALAPAQLSGAMSRPPDGKRRLPLAAPGVEVGAPEDDEDARPGTGRRSARWACSCFWLPLALLDQRRCSPGARRPRGRGPQRRRVRRWPAFASGFLVGRFGGNAGRREADGGRRAPPAPRPGSSPLPRGCGVR